jgi:hypothetical protein
MRPTELDRNHGAERACPLLAVLPSYRNGNVIKRYQLINVIVTLVSQAAGKIGEN